MTESDPLIIAVDGPAASGKGSIARHLAQVYGLSHLDTGILYRAVGLRKLHGEDPTAAARALDAETLDDPALRRPEVAKAASEVAALGSVRAALLDFQRAFAARIGGAVLDGRDIGTVICPSARAKLFVTARPEVRAARRHAELVQAGHDISGDQVLADIVARDERDSGRGDAPLRAADDAVMLDTSDLTLDEALAAARAIVDRATDRSAP